MSKKQNVKRGSNSRSPRFLRLQFSKNHQAVRLPKAMGHLESAVRYLSLFQFPPVLPMKILVWLALARTSSCVSSGVSAKASAKDSPSKTSSHARAKSTGRWSLCGVLICCHRPLEYGWPLWSLHLSVYGWSYYIECFHLSHLERRYHKNRSTVSVTS